MKIESTIPAPIKPERVYPTQLKVGQALRFSGGNILIRLEEYIYLKLYTNSESRFFKKSCEGGSDSGELLPEGTKFGIQITI